MHTELKEATNLTFKKKSKLPVSSLCAAPVPFQHHHVPQELIHPHRCGPVPHPEEKRITISKIIFSHFLNKQDYQAMYDLLHKLLSLKECKPGSYQVWWRKIQIWWVWWLVLFSSNDFHCNKILMPSFGVFQCCSDESYFWLCRFSRLIINYFSPCFGFITSSKPLHLAFNIVTLLLLPIFIVTKIMHTLVTGMRQGSSNIIYTANISYT